MLSEKSSFAVGSGVATKVAISELIARAPLYFESTFSGSKKYAASVRSELAESLTACFELFGLLTKIPLFLV